MSAPRRATSATCRDPDGDSNDETAFQVAAATWLAIDAGAKIVNYSLGFGRFAATPSEEQVAVRRTFDEVIRGSPNVLFVAGAANENWVLTASNDAPAGIQRRDVATPVLQRLLENGSGLTEDLDPEENGVTDSPGQVAARVCGGSTLAVRGFPVVEFFATDTSEGAFVQGYLLTQGFGVTLQRPDLVSLTLVCEECAWDLPPHPG